MSCTCRVRGGFHLDRAWHVCVRFILGIRIWASYDVRFSRPSCRHIYIYVYILSRREEERVMVERDEVPCPNKRTVYSIIQENDLLMMFRCPPYQFRIGIFLAGSIAHGSLSADYGHHNYKYMLPVLVVFRIWNRRQWFRRRGPRRITESIISPSLCRGLVSFSD